MPYGRSAATPPQVVLREGKLAIASHEEPQETSSRARISASTCSGHPRMSIRRYSPSAIVRWSSAWSRPPTRRRACRARMAMRHELDTCQLVGHRHLRLGTRYRRAADGKRRSASRRYDWYREQDSLIPITEVVSAQTSPRNYPGIAPTRTRAPSHLLRALIKRRVCWLLGSSSIWKGLITQRSWFQSRPPSTR